MTEQQKYVRFDTLKSTREAENMRSLTFVVPAIFITSFTTTSFSFDVNGDDREGGPKLFMHFKLFLEWHLRPALCHKLGFIAANTESFQFNIER